MILHIHRVANSVISVLIGGILLKLTSLVSLGKTIILSNYGGLCIDT